MAHDLKTSDVVTKLAVRNLKELTPFLRNTRRPIEDVFKSPGSKPGESFRIRKPMRGIGRTGDAMSPENIIQDQVTLTLDPLWGFDVEITDRQWKLEINDFDREVVQPAMLSIAARMEAHYTQVATQAAFNSVGTPGTQINNDLQYLTAGDLLTEHGAPKANRNIFQNSRAISALVNANKSLFHANAALEKQYRTGTVTGMAHGFNWFESTCLYNHNTGDYSSSTPLVNGASQSGSSLITDGWGSGTTTLNKGDVFYINNVFAVTPQGRVNTGELQAFTVTTAISDTAGAITIAISPEIKGPGDPHQNVNALPANNAEIFFQGSTVASPVQLNNTDSLQGLATHEDACCIAFVPLPTHSDVAISRRSTDPDTKISVRFEQQTEIRSGLNLARFDVLCGMAIPYPELMVRLWGA